MTIYFQIVQLFFPQAILAIRDKALTTDSLTKFFKIPRNIELSEGKQEALSELHSGVIGLPDDVNDTTSRESLNNLIDACLRDIFSKRQKNGGLGEGQTEPALCKLKNLMQEIFVKLNDLQVIDKPYDKEPLSCLRYYIALFSAKVLFDVEYESYLNRAGNNLNIYKMREITASQMELIKDIIPACIAKINETKTDLENYNEIIARNVIDFITVLQRKNVDLCRLNDTYLTSFIAPFFNPRTESNIPHGGYYLGELLVKAAAEIENNLAEQMFSKISIEQIV